MATNVGYASRMGYGVESTWGTAVAVSAALKYDSDSLDQTVKQIIRNSNMGRAARESNVQSIKNAGGNVTGVFTYDLAQGWMTHFLGTWVDDVGGDYYTLDDTTSGALTLAVDRVVAVHEFEGYKIGQLTLSGDPNAGVMFEWQGLAKQRLVTGTTNDSAAVIALSDPGAEVLFHEMVLRLGDMGDALASGDNINVSQFSLVINRNQIAQEVNATTVLEPWENGHRDVTLNVTIPRYETDQYITWHEAGTALQANLIFTGAAATKDIRISHCKIESVQVSQDDDSQAEVPIVIRCFENASAANANTGFDFTPEIQVYET